LLVDTSVWVEHLRAGLPDLTAALESGQVLTHPLVVGELACGQLRQRAEILGLLQALPAAPTLEHAEVLHFIDAHQLQGRGLGWIDMHLLAAAKLAHVPLWTLDRRLAAAASALGLAASAR
jgi:predicted nucleic acid-binding protein